MPTLHGHGPAFGLPDASPFVTKAHLLLKMAEMDYDFQFADVRKAPRGKIPFLTDKGDIIPDSTCIRWHIEKNYGFDFDAGLDARERAVAWSFVKMLEEHLYFLNMDHRWLNDENFAKGPSIFFKDVPAFIRPLIHIIVRGKVAKTMQAQGVGRYTAAEKLALVEADVKAAADILGVRPFMMGDKLTSADATAFAFLASLECPLFEGPYRQTVLKYPNLVSYLARLKARYFPA